MIDKLDLLRKGWKASEIEHASKILEEAEDSKHPKKQLADKLLIVAIIFLMILNGVICSIVLVPFIFTINSAFIILIAATIGFVFGSIFSVVLADIEKIHAEQEANLLVVLLANALVGFYLIVTFAMEFSAKSGVETTNNIYVISAAYILAFTIPHIVYELHKKRE